MDFSFSFALEREGRLLELNEKESHNFRTRPRKLRDFLGEPIGCGLQKCLLDVKFLGGVWAQLKKLFRGGEKWSI